MKSLARCLCASSALLAASLVPGSAAASDPHAAPAPPPAHADAKPAAHAPAAHGDAKPAAAHGDAHAPAAHGETKASARSEAKPAAHAAEVVPIAGHGPKPEPVSFVARGHAPAAHEPPAAPPAPKLSPAVTALAEGNERFVTGKPTQSFHPGSSESHGPETATPTVTVLSCSDSHVPPEVLLDQGAHVFSVRVVGGMVDSSALGSVEHGVANLSTKVIVVMGHTHCASVSPDATRLGVMQSMRDLLARSETLRERVRSGAAEVVGAIHDTSTDKVEWLGAVPEQAALLAGKEVPRAEIAAPAPGHDAGPKATDAHAAAAPGGEHKDSKEKDKPAEHAAPEAHAGSEGAPAGDPAKGPPPINPNPLAFAIVALVSAVGGAASQFRRD